jgi:hypothetical protein
MGELSPQRETAVESAIHAVPGQGSGLSWDYFRMLSTEDLVKADRMVLRFVAAAIGHAASRELASSLVRNAAMVLRAKYPQMTPRLLDGAI